MSTPMKPLPSRTQTVPSSRFWFNRQVQKSIGLYKIVASTTPKDYKSTKGNLTIYVQFSMEPGSQCWTKRSRSQGPLSGIFRKPQDQLLYLQLEQRSLSSVQKSTVSHFFWINSKSTCLISRRLLQKYYILPGRIRRMASCYLRMNALDVKELCCPILWTLGTYASYILKMWLVQIELCSKCVKNTPKFKDSV